jgi:hypothetical protein
VGTRIVSVRPTESFTCDVGGSMQPGEFFGQPAGGVFSWPVLVSPTSSTSGFM